MRIRYLNSLVFIILTNISVVGQFSVYDTIAIQEIVIKESKLAGGKVELIDTTVLNNSKSATLADVLAENTTIYIHSAAKGSVATASMRGAGASHTKVLWEDMPINSPMTGQVDISLLPVHFTDEVTLNYGSASLVNTGGALGGSIAVGAKPDWRNGIHTKVALGMGSFGTYSAFGQVKWANNKLSIRSRLFTEWSENNFEFYNNTIPKEFQAIEEQKNADFNRLGYLQEIRFRINEKSTTALSYWFQKSERNLPRLMNNSASNHIEKQFDDNHRIKVNYKNYGRWKWELSSGFMYSSLHYYLKNQPLGSSSLVTNIDSKSNTASSFTEFRSSKKWHNNLELVLKLGLNYHQAKFFDHKYLNGYLVNQNEQNLFLALHKHLFTKLKLSAAIRQQLIDNKLAKPIPSLGFTYQVFDNNALMLNTNVSRNYHHPTLNQLYFSPGGNASLKPEQGSTIEGALKSNLSLNKTSLYNEITTYYSRINDWILWKPSQFGYWEPINTQLVYSKGIEYNGKVVKMVWGIKTVVSIKYAYTSTTNQSTNLAEGDQSKGKQLIYIPLHSGGYSEQVVYKGFDFVWSSFYTGKRNTSTVSNTDNMPLEGYWLSNFSVGKQFTLKTAKLKLQFKVDNVFNKVYQSIQYRAMPGRSYFVLVNFEF